MSDDYRIPSKFRERLKAKAGELDVPVERVIEHMTEMLLSGQVKPIVSARTVTVEDAGEILLAHIEPSQASLIMDLCRENGRKPYEYVLSYVYLAHERGETAMLIGEQFLTANAPKGPEAQGADACEYCGDKLVNPKRGQRFCPDPDDGTPSCGRKASLDELHKNRAARTRNAVNTHAPGQANVEVYRKAAQTVS